MADGQFFCIQNSFSFAFSELTSVVEATSQIHFRQFYNAAQEYFVRIGGLNLFLFIVNWNPIAILNGIGTFDKKNHSFVYTEVTHETSFL